MEKQHYHDVIASQRWRDLRLRLLRERGHRCEMCGKTWAPGYKPKLSLHHKTYERLGNELDVDVQLLCDWCHETADVTRAKEARERAAAALYSARLDGWARRKYGDDWDLDPDSAADIEDAFDEWLESIDDRDDYNDSSR